MRLKYLAFACFALFLLLPSALALSAPDVSSSNYPDSSKWYMPTEAIRFSWEEVENANTYYYFMDKVPDTEPSPDNDNAESTTGTSAEYKKGTDGEWYFHVRAAKGVNLGPTSHFKVLLDGTRPEIRTLSATSLEDGTIKIFWDEATDASSGIAYYRLHRDRFFDFDFLTAPKRYAPLVGTSHVDTNDMGQNLTFFYLMAAVDNAGNQSRISNRATATTMAFCDINVSLGIRLSDDQQKLLISVNADSNLFESTLSLLLPDGKRHTFFGNTVFDSFSEEFDLNSVDEGNIKLDLTARERLGDDCSQTKGFIYDVTLPSVEILLPSLNETISEIFTVKADAVDNGSFKSGIESVEFLVNAEGWESVGKMTSDGNNIYSLDWNTFNYNNGRYQLKAVVEDKAGNKAEDTSGAVVLNTLYQKGDAEAAIASAEEAKKEASDYISRLKTSNVISSSLNELFDAADSNLLKALEFFEQGGNQYTNSKNFADKAVAGFSSLVGSIGIKIHKTANYIYNQEQAHILLRASSLDPAKMQEAIDMIDIASPQRQLSVIKVSDNNFERFRVNIIVSFSFTPEYIEDNNLVSLRIIEFVPKEFAETASELFHKYKYSVLQEDPILEFELVAWQVAGGKIAYGLDRDFTEEEAMAFVDNQIVNKYVVPPVLLRDSPAVGGFALPALSLGFPELPVELLLGAGLVIVVVLAAAVAFVVLKKRKKQPKKADLSIFE